MSTTPPGNIPLPDAITLLTEDHAEVAELFERYRALSREGADAAARRSLAEEICTLLLVHATIEEEIFYPAASEALEREELVDEALVEHETVRALIDTIQHGEPAQPAYDTRVQALAETVRHHIGKEEDELFPLLLESALDLDGLGARLAARQEELLSANATA